MTHPLVIAGITEMLGLEWSGPDLPELTWGEWLVWFGVLTTFSLTLSAAALWWVLRDLPSDYFTCDVSSRPRRHVGQWLLGNIAGLVVLFVGLILLLTPGQGILLIMAGVIMIDLPGKHRWERHLASKSKVLAALNWLRRKIGRDVFQAPSCSRNEMHKEKRAGA